MLLVATQNFIKSSIKMLILLEIIYGKNKIMRLLFTFLLLEDYLLCSYFNAKFNHLINNFFLFIYFNSEKYKICSFYNIKIDK